MSSDDTTIQCHVLGMSIWYHNIIIPLFMIYFMEVMIIINFFTFHIFMYNSCVSHNHDQQGSIICSCLVFLWNRSWIHTSILLYMYKQWHIVYHGFHMITLFAVVAAFTTISLESSEMSSSNCMPWERERERGKYWWEHSVMLTPLADRLVAQL
jgi:hypothetical protein